MKLPPDIELHAMLDVMRHAILQARVWGWDGNVNSDQLADLMEAVYNIPGTIQHWDSNEDSHIKQELEIYERKWAKSGGPCLRTHYESIVNPSEENDSTS